MSPATHPRAQLLRVGGAVVALWVGYWGIRVRPRRVPTPLSEPGGVLTAAEAALMAERLELLLGEGREAEALPLAERLARDFPDNAVFLERAATLSGKAGRLEEAADLWGRCEQVSPSPGDAAVALGRTLRDLGRRDEALAAFQRALAAEPSNSEFRFHLGRAQEAEGRYELARDTYRQAGANTDALAGWARMEVFIGDPARARARAEAALARNPDHLDALLAHAMALRQSGDYGRARVSLARGLRRSPGNGDFLLVLAGLDEAEGRTEEARRHYEAYLAARPGDDAARARYEKLGGRPR